MNEEDSEQIGLYLQQIGFHPAASLREAQVLLLNTCSVRKKPEDKAFSLLGEIALMKNQRQDLVVGVCGCMAQLRAKEIHQRAPHVDFVVGTAHIASIPGLVEEAIQRRKFAQRLDLPERKGAVVTDLPTRDVNRVGKLKAFVPIQYGCDKFCSFCIVPTTRGRERSRPTADIVSEVERLAALGTKEVTLLGQTVNSYGKNMEEGKVPFSDLLRQVAAVKGIERIRYTSPYPRDFRTDLIETIRDVPQVMEHCHMPLQSGDNEMLRSMKRLYTRESFGEILAEMNAKIPGLLITTDLIVGFPGETEAQFEATLSAVAEFNFYSSYMFIYSPRPGTPAADQEQLPYALKQRRLKILADAQFAQTQRMNEAFVGQEFEVLVEGRSEKTPELLRGYSRNFVMTHFAGDADRLRGELVTVRVTAGYKWGCMAELI
ncbi:MAG: tRNA (N6-isopentenyl adenosine(37)-C2)-methylthiotransferase MiaB [Chthonomonas sp.]|nr:tRNA (N6-isopentenyl adenosine(37)-C2)-methylthiotransferase MiaB [Chthonomonas sp.]